MPMKLIYHDRFYVSDQITQKQLHSLKRKLRRDPRKVSIFLLTTARNPHDELEIYSSDQLVAWYRGYAQPAHVVGLAMSKNEAITLVEKIVQDCFEKRGDFALKEYLLW
jgi:hypothetical protein